ncbi:hypothetical protein ACH4TV_32340 [Streptomyces sp. NPDC020898]|uniref:hypothetical protein n=1 Tax=Streptomyces sp. NPDC020898 TaxID=3365101 RepID=UPI0037A026E7
MVDDGLVAQLIDQGGQQLGLAVSGHHDQGDIRDRRTGTVVGAGDVAANGGGQVARYSTAHSAAGLPRTNWAPRQRTAGRDPGRAIGATQRDDRPHAAP